MHDVVPLPPRTAPIGAVDRAVPTYYGQPAVKPSLWGWLVSSYIFIAGIGGSAQILATAADLAGDRAFAPVIRNGRYIALGAAVLGGPLLIIDLHTPQRYYNMLRIFRKTSPMSIGTYVLMSFGSLSAALAALQVASDRGYRPGRAMQAAIKLLEVPAAFAGMGMSTYTGALLSATSNPLWGAAPRHIAAAFGASAMASGTAALTIAEQCSSAPGSSTEQSRDLGRIALVVSAVEFFLLLSLRRRFHEEGVDGALNDSGWGLAYDLGAVALGAGLPMLSHTASVIAPERAPRLKLATCLAILAGGFLLRHVLLRAGNASAERPKDYFRFAGSRRYSVSIPSGNES
jgi:formate-dependent nitrite reductase membrane component NrfD